MRDSSRLEQLLPWFVRAAWVLVLVAGGEAIDGATGDRSAAVHDVARYGGFVVWVIAAFTLAVPAVITLTASRLVVPLALPAAVVTAFSGADGGAAASFVAASTVASVLVTTAEFGRRFVQASAYGEEDRHPLRPPAAYLIASTVTWAAWATACIAAPLLLADRRWVVGGIVAALAVALTILGWPRWHRLSERWFVVVPIGVVVHDPLVLAETVMLRRQEIAHLRLAHADTEAADLTGPASGHAIEIGTRESTTVILAATPKKPTGTAIHLTACLIAPTRPGHALRASGARKLPVG